MRIKPLLTIASITFLILAMPQMTRAKLKADQGRARDTLVPKDQSKPNDNKQSSSRPVTANEELPPVKKSEVDVAMVTPAQSHQAAKSSSVKLGDTVIVIPNPEGFEEASSQFEKARQALVKMETPGFDNLLLHMPASDCERARTGSRPEFRHYTKVSVDKSRRELTSSDADMAGLVAEFRKHRAALLDPDGPALKFLMENFSRQLSEAASKPIQFEANNTQHLGEFDVRPNVYSVMVFLTYTKEVERSESMRQVVASMTWLKVGPRIINIGVYRNISSPEAVKTELKPTVIELKQFTTKWVNEILAANQTQR